MFEAHIEMNNEHTAWKDIWHELKELTGFSQEVLDNEKWRELAKLIERWAYYDRIRRDKLKEIGEWKEEWEYGVFWNPDKNKDIGD